MNADNDIKFSHSQTWLYIRNNQKTIMCASLFTNKVEHIMFFMKLCNQYIQQMLICISFSKDNMSNKTFEIDPYRNSYS